MKKNVDRWSDRWPSSPRSRGPWFRHIRDAYLKQTRYFPYFCLNIVMFIYFIISILLNHCSINAAPILTERAPGPDESKPDLRRTLFGIIWSCLSTILICAWTSVHPNVPPPNRWKARWNRLRLMFWMIIAPELVLAWAVRQLFGAREIRDEYNRMHPGTWLLSYKWDLDD